MITLQDARKEKQNYNDALFAKLDKLAAEQSRIETILAQNPGIGMIVRNGKQMYYRFLVNGVDCYEESSDPAELV